MNETNIISLSDKRLLVSPIGFRLIDDLTGEGPIGRVNCILDARATNGTWLPGVAQAQRNGSGILIFPGLGRTVRRGLAGVPAMSFRARFQAEFYIPFYRRTQDALLFSVFPHNDEEPPANLTGVPIDVVLTPAPAFPFPRSLKLLRGQVIGSSGPIADAEVSQPNIECVVTDRKGCYALPLRQVPNGKPVEINATDHRTRRVGHITIVLPDALGRSQPITIR